MSAIGEFVILQRRSRRDVFLEIKGENEPRFRSVENVNLFALVPARRRLHRTGIGAVVRFRQTKTTDQFGCG